MSARRGASLALLCLLDACTPSGPVAVDLLDLFPYTDAGQVVRQIDLGSPAAAAHLRSGWSGPGELPGGERGAWAMAHRARVQFGIRRPADASLVLRCGLLAAHAPNAGMIVASLNGRRLGVVRVGRTLADRRLRVPGPLERRGLNVLELTNMLLSDLPRNRSRELARAVAVAAIRLEGVNDEEGPSLRHEGAVPPRLVLPAAAGVDFFLHLPRVAELVFDLAPDGARGAALRVALQVEGEAEHVVADDLRGPSAVRRALPPNTRGPVHLSFHVAGNGSVALVRPRILGATELAPRRAESPPAATPANVLLYVIDTLRADHLGCYGYSRATSPNIDALSDGGILFTRMVAQSSWTRPATASILTGLDPLAHGASTLSARIRPQVVTLADLLHARGYHTAAFVTNVNVRGEMGFRRGFDEYVYLPEDHERPTVHLPADELNAHVFRWLEERRPTPFFLYVHASDPHAPYHPPAAIAARFLPTDGLPPIAGEHDPLRLLLADRTARTEENLSYLRALYDGEIAFTDEAFGALRGKLRELGLEAGTLVAVTADHGEEFLDHGGFEHGRTLYGELLRVPFILRLPRGERGGQQIERLARQVDVVPTLLAALGLPARGELPGSDLLASDGPEPEAFSHTGLGSAEIMALTTTGWKVIHRADRQHDTFEIYDLREDPAERRDLAASRPVLLGYGRQALVRRAVDVPRPAYGVEDQAAIIDSDTARRLRALGYVSR